MRRVLALALCLMLCLAGCAPAPVPDNNAPEEGHRLTVYTSHKEEVWWPVVKEFEERTGLWVEVVEGGTNELLSRISREQSSPAADVMFGGGVESLTAYAGLFEPYVSRWAEDIDPKFLSPEGLWTPFSALPVVLVYNTKLIGAESVTGWQDLLSPEFRGRIAFADPFVSGSSFTSLLTLTLALEGDREDILAAFAENLGGSVLPGSGDVVAAVSDGTAIVGVTLEETALKAVAAGSDIRLVYPAEGTSSVPDGGALVKNAPHRENAALFLDFIAGADVQQLVSRSFYRRSVRTDVSSDLPDLRSLPLVEYDVAGASREHDGLLTTWAFYLGKGDNP